MTAKFASVWAMSFGASHRLARLAAVVAASLLAGQVETLAQTPSSPVAGVDAGLLEDMVIGSRVLADFGVLDGFGHVSARHPTNPNHFLMARSLAPALVTADDIMEFDLDGNAVDARGRTVPGALHPRGNLQGAAGRDVGGSHPFSRRHPLRRDQGAVAGDVS